VNPGRPGFVVVGGLVSSLTGSDPLRVTAVLPAVMAASAALAWGALVRTVLGWRPVASAFLALFVGTSPFVVHAIGVEGYQDATMALAVFSAAAVPVLVAAGRASGSRAVWPAAILVGAAGTIHWSFLPVIEAILGLCALAFVPAAVRARPRGLGAIVDSPPGRIASIGVLGFALASLWLLVLLPAGLPHAELVVGQLLDKLSRDVPQLGLWFVLPLAAVGAISLTADDGDVPAPNDGSRDRTAFLSFTLAWCEVTLLAVAAVWLLGIAIPGHRILAFCLALPALAGVGLVWLAERVAGSAARSSRPRSPRRWLGIGLTVLGLLLSGAWAQHTWLSFHPVMRATTVDEARSASAILERARVPAGRPVVFVMDDRGTYAWSRSWITAHTIRAALEPDRIGSTSFFVGRPQDLLAGRPTRLPIGPNPAPGAVDAATYDSLSATYFRGVKPVLAKAPIVLMLSSTDPWFGAWVRSSPSRTIAPGVAIVDGSLASGTAPPVPPAEPLSVATLVGIAALSLALLWVVGSGWTVTLLGRWLDLSAIVALSPAVGTGILVLGGIALGRLGVRLDLAGAIATVLVLTVAGLAAPILRARRSTRSEAGGPSLAASRPS
jgi:hypothetical protein